MTEIIQFPHGSWKTEAPSGILLSKFWKEFTDPFIG